MDAGLIILIVLFVLFLDMLFGGKKQRRNQSIKSRLVKPNPSLLQPMPAPWEDSTKRIYIPEQDRQPISHTQQASDSQTVVKQESSVKQLGKELEIRGTEWQKAVVLADILGAPKALRNRRRHS